VIVLSIDQASNKAGVSLWNNAQLLGTTTLLSRARTDTFSKRLQHQIPQLTAFLKDKPQVEHILFEGVRARLVMATVGAFLSCPLLDVKLHEKTSFVGSSTWKKYAKNYGAIGPIRDVKGYPALKQIGFPVDKYGLTLADEDICDSILIYMAWYEKRLPA
jgi:hypothetical protein